MKNFTSSLKPAINPRMEAFLALIILMAFAGCAAPRKCTMLIHMMPSQEKFFKDSIIVPFEKKYRCEINVGSYAELDGIEAEMANYPGKAILIKTPFEQTKRLAEKGLMMSIDSAVGPKGMVSVRDRFFLLQLASFDGKLYYFPRKFETRILVYLKSRVADAVENWHNMRARIDSTLKIQNGFGIPSGYMLEPNPGEWDYYDIFVAGYYWAHRDSGSVTPKVAHRGKRYSGTFQRLIDRAYQLGGTRENIVTMNGEQVIDLFEWEAVYTRENIYNRNMWDKGWSGADVWEGFRSGEVYLSFMTQLDCFSLHGNYTKEQPGYIENPDDFGYALMPEGVSFRLDENGKYLRKGSRAICTGGWWWGIPRDTPYPDLSVALANWVLNTDNQVEECERFGMIPVAKELLGDLGLLFGKNWISDIYEVSLQQLIANQYTTAPLTGTFKELETIYLDALNEIAAQGNWGPGDSISREYIRNIIELKYAKKAQQLAQ
ncbi:MAG: hypothetical protein A2487_07565 [Candidatus Raymondbacteria bacterium RifOxyC12_full_50_8]|nr:MAG: hypothetical protein A2248_14035 [Candidatus Raymondbacteria bacterium RIFOXYA2_FULL_49_16]OGJ95564.1 MAG: hypothetical protein A2453_12810 [Candidatus Raymondbacteria bacterium RIFOXYC2_FULL_50_21]OGJ99460.1 MAG: hypothetical protein A2487_07565 [Candidatus Raymondbacteria bacterium RifOxyC12_full_50_8]